MEIATKQNRIKKLELEKINNNKIKLFNETHDILRKSGDTLFLSQNIIIIESPKNIE